jgi:hypothetical protein
MFAIKIIFKNLIALGFWPDGCFFPSFKIIFSYLFTKMEKKREKKKDELGRHP